MTRLQNVNRRIHCIYDVNEEKSALKALLLMFKIAILKIYCVLSVLSIPNVLPPVSALVSAPNPSNMAAH